jgi:hypothetical protein
MTEEDLKKTVELLDEFRTRHATITSSLNETYRIGNKILDYLEK